MRVPRLRAWVPRAVSSVLLVASVVALAATAAPQRRQSGGGRNMGVSQRNPPYDGRFMFCRVMFREALDGDGSDWSVDYPRADLNLPFRLAQLSSINVSKDESGEPKHVLIDLNDERLFECPFIMMTEVGTAYFDEAEAGHLHDYLMKGGFLWADDFWGEYAWAVWQRAIGTVLPPSEYPIIDLPLSHPIFHNFYEVGKVPQIPSITHWLATGSTSERWDSQVPHARAILNARGDIMVLITHNTDFGDAFEREGFDRGYFDAFAGPGYAFGVNAVMYALSH